MTLSHCWGNEHEHIQKLTMANYKDMTTTGISFAKLPKSFQDAIRLSRFLGVNYLCIDSLCIIQDSPGGQDWKEESKTMTKIYQNSRCNIAASASTGPTLGCFYPRDPFLMHPMKITLCSAQKPDIGRETDSPDALQTYLFSNPLAWSENIEWAPLNKRAWVLQERVLSPRQLHCGHEQLLWECHEHVASESFPATHKTYSDMAKRANRYLLDKHFRFGPDVLGMKGICILLEDMKQLLKQSQDTSDQDSTHRRKDVRLFQSNHTIRYKDTSSERRFPGVGGCPGSLSQKHGTDDSRVSLCRRIVDKNDEVQRCWGIIVNQYSKCSLTFTTDKLVAIPGVATLIQDTLQGMDIYVAGLWLSQLPTQLLWTTGGFLEKGHSLYNVAPSWSWASLDTAVFLPQANHPPRPTYINILEVYNAHTITGQLADDNNADTHLKLDCLLYTIKPTRLAHKSCHIITGPCKFGHSNTDHIPSLNTTGNRGYCHFIMDENDDEPLYSSRGAYVMPIMKTKERGRTGIRGLIIVACEGKPGFFRRAGIWDMMLEGKGWSCREFWRHLDEGVPEEYRRTVTLI